MKKKTKGFTLIELLAIIVILAIIAVITVPIILNVIDNAKKGTAKDSAYGYKDAISKYYVTEMYKDNNITLNGDYTVDSNGVLSNETETHEIIFSGTKPKGGYLTYSNNVLISGCITIDDYKVEFTNGEATNVILGKCEMPAKPVTYKCKRATQLHTEECTQTSTSSYCSGAGYTTTGSKGTTKITYGNPTVTQGILTSGDAYDCDVNGNGDFGECTTVDGKTICTERFYYVSDLYNTTTQQFDNTYAILIYYNNTVNGQPDNTSLSKIAYDVNNKNYNGPLTTLTNLPTNEIWTNITLSNINRVILNENGTTSTIGSTIIPIFEYKNNNVPLSARLLTTQELAKGCNMQNISRNNGLSNCIYLLENTKFSSSSIYSGGYWLENPTTISGATSSSVWEVTPNVIYYKGSGYPYTSGVRPVIEVLKTDIEI